MSKKEKAVKLFELRFNCSQAIFAAYCQGGELDEVTALKLSTVFGAGVACAGQGPCGAVAGALMALSMKHGRGDLESVDAKTETYEIGRQFMAEFKARNGSFLCLRTDSRHEYRHCQGAQEGASSRVIRDKMPGCRKISSGHLGRNALT